MSIFLFEGEVWESNKIREIFSLESKLTKMQRMEAALANAQAELGIIPKEAAKVINEMVGIEYLDLDIYNEQLRITGGHPVVPFLKAWQPFFKDKEIAQLIHYGATTQDVLDTSMVLQFKEVYDVVIDELEQLKVILGDLSQKYKMTPMAGRTHSQHAVPITFGYKTAIWLYETQRQIDRLKESSKRMFAVSFYGATGNVNSLGKNGMKVCELMAKDLGLAYIPLPWHTSRDTMAEFLSDLVNITCTYGKIGNELYELGRTEVLEVQEPWFYGNVGSSTMPQKRNAFGMEVMTAIGRLSSYQIGAMFQAMMQQHERDFRTQDGEGFTYMTICHMCEHVLAYAIPILKGLDVLPQNMRKNLDITNGAIMCENVMMHLAKAMGRFEAHEKVYKYAVQAFEENKHIKDLILADKDIMAVMTPEEIEEVFDPVSYIGVAPEMVDRAIKDCLK